MSQVLVTGFFRNEPSVRDALGMLKKKGIASEEVALVESDSLKGHPFRVSTRTESPRTALRFACVGAVLGAAFGAWRMTGQVASATGGVWISGAAVGAIVLGAMGLVTGLLLGWWAGHRVPLYQLRFGEPALSRDKLFVGFLVEEDRAEEASELLRDAGAREIAQADQKYQKELAL